MGSCVGLSCGALFGGFSGFRYGLRGGELVRSVGKVMLQGAGTFGTFMAIGSGIRCWINFSLILNVSWLSFQY